MATIKLKRGTSAPTTSNIVDGEVAVDKSSQKLYIRDGSTIKEIGRRDSVPLSGGTMTGNLTVPNLSVTSTNYLGFGDYGERLSGNNVAGTLTFYTDATLALTLDNSQDATFSGRVGIGNTPVTGVGLTIREDSTTNVADFRNANASGYGLYVAGGSSSGEYALKVADKDHNGLFTVKGNGRVGIGATAPGNIVEVAGASPVVEINATSGNPELQFSDGGTDEFSMYYDTGANAFKFTEGGVGTHLTIADGGDATFAGDVTAQALQVSNNITFSGVSANAYKGIVPETDQNLMLGTGSGDEPRIYLKGTANGQSDAGDLFLGAGTGGTIILNGPSINCNAALNVGGSGFGTLTWGTIGSGSAFGIRSGSGKDLSIGAGASWDVLRLSAAGDATFSGDITFDGGKKIGLERVGGAGATVGPGWMTVATNTSGNRHGEVIVTDADSNDHGFVRIDWMRSFSDSNFTVFNTGGHNNRITGCRVLSQDSNNTYGTKILQVYVTVSSTYEVDIYHHHGTDDYSAHTAVTPVIEDTKTGYSLHGKQLEDLNIYGFAAEEGIRAGGALVVGGPITVGDGHTIGNDADDNLVLTSSANENLLLDSAHGVYLDHGSSSTDSIYLRKGGGTYAYFRNSSDDLLIGPSGEDHYIFFQGNDGGSTINMLRLDASAGGDATFAGHIELADNKYVKLGADADFIIYHDGTSNYVQAAKQDSDIIFRGNDGGTGTNMLTLDTSAAGEATFNAGATFGGNVQFDKLVTGGFGATSTSGTLDFDHLTNSRPGMGYTLLQGGDTNGPELEDGLASAGAGAYYYTMNYEYSTKDGSGSITQIAIPYARSTNSNVSYNKSALSVRTRYSGTWSSWARYLYLDVATSTAQVDGNLGIESNGAVSLGSTDVALQVGSSSHSTPTIQIRSGTSGKGQLWFGDNSGTDAGRYDGYIEYDQSGRDFRIGTACTERMRIDSSGNVGVGVTNPSDYYAKDLVVTGPSEGGITIAATDDHTNYLLFADSTSGVARYAGMVGYSHPNDLMSFRTNSIQRMVIDSNGDVGIGSTNPDGVLDLGNATGGRGIVWGGATGANNYGGIWSEYGSASIIIGAGLKSPYPTANAGFRVPYTGTYGYAAIELDSFSDDGIKFYVGPDAAVTKDDVITPTEVMRLATNGRLGLGTTSPSSLLHLESASSPSLRIVDTTNDCTLLAYSQNSESIIGTYSTHNLGFFTDSGRTLTLDTSHNATFVGQVTAGTSGGTVVLKPADGSGNTSIEIQAATGKQVYLDLGGADVTDYFARIIADQAGGTGTQFISKNGLVLDPGTGAVHLKHGDTDKLATSSSGVTVTGNATVNEGGEPNASGTLLLQANSSSRQIRIAPPSNAANGYIDYRGGNLLFKDDGTEVARFQGSTSFNLNGKLQLYTTDDQAHYYAFYTHTDDTLRINYDNSGNDEFLMNSSGDLSTTGTITASQSNSDIRLKENIQVISDAVSKVKSLRGVTFNFKESGEAGTGLIAQEVQEVLPEAVYTAPPRNEGDDFLALHYGNTVGLLIEAIKEQQAQIEALTKRLEEVEG